MKRPVSTDLLVSMGGALVLAVCLALPLSRKEVSYKDKPISKWFYGERRDFLLKSTRERAEEAINALGTNALPFLVRNLNRSGNSSLYFNFYRALPTRIQARLQYPISGDDVHYFSLNYLSKLGPLPEPTLASLAQLIPQLPDPRIRLHGLTTLVKITETQEGREHLVRLCKSLLDDAEPGIRFHAAIRMAKLGVRDARCISVLRSGLADDGVLKASVSLQPYRFGQPPGGSGSAPGGGRIVRGTWNQAEQEKMFREDALRALQGLEGMDEHHGTLSHQFELLKK